MDYHISEHERLQILQRHALNNNKEAMIDLLNTFPIDKQGDLLNMIEEIREDKKTVYWRPTRPCW